MKTAIPDAGLKRAPDSEQHMREALEALKPRGKGPDPLKDTYLDKTPDQVVQPVETVPQMAERKRVQEKTTKGQVKKVEQQISTEKGQLQSASSPGLPSFSIHDPEQERYRTR